MNHSNKIAVIIPAAGASSRFGGLIPKQFSRLGDETVLEKSVNLFLGISSVNQVVIAVNQNEDLIKAQSFYQDPRIKIVAGGSTRSESVFNAMAEVDESVEIVAIHDAARPWLKKIHFEDLLSHLANDQSIEGVFPVISTTDSLLVLPPATI